MKKKVLIVEDEEIMIELLKRKLIKEGYEVFVSRNGEQGIETLKQENPDIILLDIIMPRMGGFEMMENIIKQKIKKIPIIIVSNSGQPIELERAKKLGASDWLIKAEFDPQEVVDKVRKQIGS